MREHRPATILEHERALIRAALVDVADTVGPFATSSSRTSTTFDAPPIEFPGYELLHEIHRGGQGVVFKAQQIATRRTVALKWLRNGPLATPRERHRFEREVEILAQLRHPHVVAIHDSGTTAGHFYCVMDCVDGRPLVTRAVPNRRAMLDALRLFATICDAVQAAHVAGVAHRDLKPSNILIDGTGEPRVIDFGLAKPVAGVDDSDATQTGQFVGSLQWASPEQVRGASDVDLRTDVYSLGVVLFQMLTGEFPYANFVGARSIMECVLNAPPRRPRTLNGVIDDDVETIILRCLSKERERRYQSAGDLAGDVRRYLAGEAIEAKRDSAGYVLWKTARRYRIALMFLLTVLLLSGTFVTIAFRFWGEMERAKQITISLATQVTELLHIAGPVRRPEFEESLNRIEEIADQLSPSGISAEPDLHIQIISIYRAWGERHKAWARYEQLLFRVRKVHGRESDSYLRVLSLVDARDIPSSQVEFVYNELAMAESLVRARHGEPSAQFAEVRAAQADLAWWSGDIARWDNLYREAIQCLRIQAPESQAMASALKQFGDRISGEPLRLHTEAEVIKREALGIARRNLNPREKGLADWIHSLSVTLRDLGRYDEAEPLAREALAIREGAIPRRSWYSYYIDISALNVGTILMRQGKFETAERQLLQAYEGLSHHPFFEMREHERAAACRLDELYLAWEAVEPEGPHILRADRWRERIPVPEN